jgi:F0F1-type ATP synthase delta subunit
MQEELKRIIDIALEKNIVELIESLLKTISELFDDRKYDMYCNR